MDKPRPLALIMFAVLVLGPSPMRGREGPVTISFFELEEHRTAGKDSFRSADAPSGDTATLFLDIVIDEDGNVIAVARSPDNSRGEIRRWYRRAEALARRWQFRPFTRGGRAVQARARAQVDVLPLERWGRQSRFPDVPLEQYSVTLTRGGCFGNCPIYSVTIHGDGRVRFEGGADVAVTGVQEAVIPVDRVERLIARFRRANFWSLRTRYRARIPDAPGHELTVRAGSLTKSVSETEGRAVGMPDVVRALQDAVDEAAGTARWIRHDGASELKH